MAASEADEELIKEVQNIVFEAEAAILSSPDFSSLKEDIDSMKGKIALLKQLVTQQDWNNTHVEKSLDELKLAREALKAKIQEEQNKQKPENLNSRTAIEGAAVN